MRPISKEYIPLIILSIKVPDISLPSRSEELINLERKDPIKFKRKNKLPETL